MGKRLGRFAKPSWLVVGGGGLSVQERAPPPRASPASPVRKTRSAFQTLETATRASTLFDRSTRGWLGVAFLNLGFDVGVLRTPGFQVTLEPRLVGTLAQGVDRQRGYDATLVLGEYARLRR
jgi:hypothetical protein